MQELGGCGLEACARVDCCGWCLPGVLHSSESCDSAGTANCVPHVASNQRHDTGLYSPAFSSRLPQPHTLVHVAEGPLGSYVAFMQQVATHGTLFLQHCAARYPGLCSTNQWLTEGYGSAAAEWMYSTASDVPKLNHGLHGRHGLWQLLAGLYSLVSYVIQRPWALPPPPLLSLLASCTLR
jgi:hypothetical protein